ncbi:hypothetical protein [Taklimakanibacter deserti]|uniref:hypothetical protein n=1 Tax=Taklimakanibacter deserti TaxID=2267839 RepID=UPI0013C4BE05
MDPAPVTPELLDAATRWSSWSWWGLIAFGIIAAITAIATVAFTFIQFWSGGVLGRHSEWRTATLERETARANERTAELQKEAEAAKLEQERLRQLLAWRRLTADQMKKLVDELTGITFPVTLQVNNADPEATRFAADIGEVFQQAGISYEKKTAIVFSDDPIPGLRVYGRADEVHRIADPFHRLGIAIDGQQKDADLVFHVAAKPPPKP